MKKGNLYVIKRASKGIIGFGSANSCGLAESVTPIFYDRKNDVLNYTFSNMGDREGLYGLVYLGASSTETITVEEYSTDKLSPSSLVTVENLVDSPITSGTLYYFPIDIKKDDIVKIDFNIQQIGSANVQFYNAENDRNIVYTANNSYGGQVFAVADKDYQKIRCYSSDGSNNTLKVDKVLPLGEYLNTISADSSKIIANGGYEFELGGIADDDTEMASTTRCRTPYIKVGGNLILYSPLYDFSAISYDAQKVRITTSYAEMGNWLNVYSIPQTAKYIRIVSRADSNNSTITDETIAEMISSTFIVKNDLYDFVVEKQSEQRSKDLWVRAQDGFSQLESKTPYTEAQDNSFLTHGKITKNGRYIEDKDGERFVLRGIGTHSISEYNNLYNADVMKTLLLYGINCIRISVYLTGGNYQHSDGRTALGWLTDSDQLKPIIENLVSVATDSGLYVILDWHSYHTIDGGDVTQYTDQQKAFFTYFSTKYATQTNILYELHNEPYQNTAQQLLSSVSECASIIRSNNADAILICGNGSDGVDAMQNLFNVENNLDVFISPHLYTGEQTVDGVIKPVFESGYPIFVSEWGNSSLSGTDDPNDVEALKMFNYCHEHGISYCLWKMTYQDMDTAVLRYDPDYAENYYPFGGWHDSDLSHNGHLYFDTIRQTVFGLT